MHQRIKAFFYHLSKRKIYSFPLIATALLFFPKITFAAFWDTLVGAINYIPSNIIILLTQGVIAISSFLAAIASEVLEWVLSPNFTNLSYTNPGKNPIIEIGLNITQSFVNMALVLVLVFIAFATILRLKEYQTQKLLITLIVVALLVNFAPVICGLVIDPCNILMHYFTDHITGFKTIINMSSGYGERISALFGFSTFTEQAGMLAESLVLITFNFLLFFITLTYALIFAVRYAVIWVLVILSPLAFVSYILPATKKIWNQWLNQFLNWSIIGISTGFFLYLSEQVIEKANIVTLGAPASNSVGAGTANIPLQYMIPLIFMFIGLMFAFQTSAMGASQVLSFAKKHGQKARGWAEKGGRKTVKGIYKGTASGLAGAYRGAKGGTGFKGKMGGFAKGAAKGASPQGQGEMSRWVRRQGEKVEPYTGIGGKIGTVDSEEKAKMKEAETRMAALSIEKQRKIARRRTFGSEKAKLEQIAALNNIAKDKKLKKEEIDQIKNMVKAGETGLDIKAIIAARPDLAPSLTKRRVTTKQQVQGLTNKKLMEEVQPEAFNQIKVVESLTNAQVTFMERNASPDAKEKRRNIQRTVNKNRHHLAVEMNRLRLKRDPESTKEARRILEIIKRVNGPNFI